MKNKKILSAGFGALLAVGAMSTLAACGGDDNGGSAGTGDTRTEAPPAETNGGDSDEGGVDGPVDGNCDDLLEDLMAARQAVLDGLNDDIPGPNASDWTQIMLADDVPVPEVKYGLLVMPFHRTDAASRVTRTANINNGNFTLTADSAATGLECQIDQDGNVSLVD
ncbi:MAG: hypothetical protein FWD83_05575 [Promicromonosporaceae bacterium]|nr:hypothetical protein [Promicromonosporaceae bacterium]